MTWFKENKIFSPAGGGGNVNGQHPGQRAGDIPVWYQRFEYDLGTEVLAPDGLYYRCIADHIASENFVSDIANWVPFGGAGAADTNDQEIVLDVDNVTLRLRNGTVGGIPVPDTIVDLSPFAVDDQQISQTVLPNGDVQIDLTGDNPSSFILDQGERRHSNSLFVDPVYGDDGTGVRERWDKPFSTYPAASAAAFPGDRIVLRPGFHGDLLLKDQVDIDCETGATAFRIIDNSIPVTCKVSGQLDLNYGGNSAVNIAGNGSNVSIDCKDISAIGTGININPGATGVSNVTINCRRLLGTTINYNVTIRGGGNLQLFVEENFESAAFTSGFASIILGFTYTGRSIIKANKIFIGDSISPTGGVLVSAAATAGDTGYLKLEVDEVENVYNGANNLLYPMVHSHNDATVDITCNKMVSKVKTCFGGTFVRNGKITFTGYAECQENEVVHIGSTSRFVFTPGSVLHRNNGGADLNKTVVIGTPPGAGSFFGKQSNNLRSQFDGVAIVKTSAAGIDTGYILGVSGTTSETIIRNCDIIGLGVNAATPACDALDVANGNIYFKNTHSNKDNTVNITDTAVVSGFVANDLQLNTFDL